MSSTVHVSVVTSMYRSAAFLEEFYARVVAAATTVSSSYEIVFVNDGSPDDSLAVALRLRDRDPRVRVLDLSRNFGHHKAMMTGLAAARGDLIFLLDCDLEDQPEWLVLFYERLTGTRADAVYGVQTSRKGGLFERISGSLFYTVVNRLMTPPLPRNLVTARLMTRRYVDALVQHRDREVAFSCLCLLAGFEQHAVPVVKMSRAPSSYTLRKKLSILVNTITSFSNRPLIYIFYVGVAVMLVAGGGAGVLIYQTVTNRIGVPGYASIVVSIWFLGGLTIFCLGIIGIYLAKIFTEVKDRPYTIVRAEYGVQSGRAPDEHAHHPAGSAVLRG